MPGQEDVSVAERPWGWRSLRLPLNRHVFFGLDTTLRPVVRIVTW